MFTEYCASAKLTSNYPSYSNESPNLHTEVLEIPSHRWELTFSSNAMKEETFDDFWPLVERLKAGRPFTWTPPKLSQIRGVGGDGQTNDATAGSESVTVYNAPPNVLWLRRNDLINFANQTKVYRLLEDVITDNAGMGTLTLNCPLKTALSAGTVVNGSGAVFTLIKKPGAKPLSYEYGAGTSVMKSVEIEFIELL